MVVVVCARVSVWGVGGVVMWATGYLFPLSTKSWVYGYIKFRRELQHPMKLARFAEDFIEEC